MFPRLWLRHSFFLRAQNPREKKYRIPIAAAHSSPIPVSAADIGYEGQNHFNEIVVFTPVFTDESSNHRSVTVFVCV